jgi:hypothetical protein
MRSEPSSSCVPLACPGRKDAVRSFPTTGATDHFRVSNARFGDSVVYGGLVGYQLTPRVAAELDAYHLSPGLKRQSRLASSPSAGTASFETPERGQKHSREWKQSLLNRSFNIAQLADRIKKARGGQQTRVRISSCAGTVAQVPLKRFRLNGTLSESAYF